jgi:cytochrome b6-f complex iron-sulfur subunit
VLHGIGAAALGGLALGGCGQQGTDLSTAATTTCGGNTCIDLSDAANSALATVGGAMVIDLGSDTVAVIRTGDTAVVALSDVCTHDRCTMDYDAGADQLTCPCHGSVFSLDGRVVRGPANRAVKVYTAALASNTITIIG